MSIVSINDSPCNNIGLEYHAPGFNLLSVFLWECLIHPYLLLNDDKNVNNEYFNS